LLHRDPSAAVHSIPLLRPSRNCWRISHAEKAAVLVDAAAYFRALEDALTRAERSIFILGWDFDGRIALRPDVAPKRTLGPFLRSLVETRPELEIRLLVWNLAVVHAPGSPMELLAGADWQEHPRISVRLDTDHPLYAAQHQKIVCIDDRMAFVGGIDLTVRRWDTPEHRAHHPARTSPDGETFGPVHDMQMAVEGAVARDLGELVRGRWSLVTGEDCAATAPCGMPWPPEMPADFEDVEVAISRTAPAWKGTQECRESAALSVDALRSARDCIYIEAQYLTAPLIGDVLEERLEQKNGPEIVVILTAESHGLGERFFMGHNRDRLLCRLRRADRHGRFRALYPVVPSADGDCQILVHAKLMIIDDRLLRIGSANLNNRSIGLDSECDLAVDGTTADLRTTIGRLRDRLLAHHLGVAPEIVTAAVADAGSAIAALDSLNQNPRGLRRFDLPDTPPGKGSVFGTALFDPVRPFRLLAPVGRLKSFIRRRRYERRRKANSAATKATSPIASGSRK